MTRLVFTAATLGAALALAPATAQRSVPADAEKISDNVYRIGKVIVDLKGRTVTCSAKINMQRGLVEYFAVATRGKLHESVLEVDARPLHIQLGLIMLGLEPQGGLRYQGDTKLPKGPPVDVSVSWEKAGTEVKLPAEQLVWDLNKKRPMEANPWVFSGSMVTIAGFAADSEKSLIATYRDPVALINNRLPTGSDDTVYVANHRVVPREGTEVQLIIHAPTADHRQ